MSDVFYSKKTKTLRKFLCSLFAFIFFSSFIIGPGSVAHAQYITNLPKPGEMVLLSPVFEPVVLKGMTIHPENPLQFDFIIDRGEANLSGDALKDETQKLLKYFLAAMTIPDDDSWVNLSPYESDRIVPDMLGSTDMGKAMLEQDYLLKQLSASLTNPQEEIGKKFWNTVYKKAYEKFGTTSIPINTFNKVWITPDSANVIEQDGYVFIGDTHLKVMLDEDYTSLKEDMKSKKSGTEQISQDKVEELSKVSSAVVREIIIPELEKEINQGKNFASVRQMYHSVILATWYKQNLKNSLLGKVYVDKNKISGVNIDEKDLKQKIYEQYLAAFRTGVYNLIKEDYDLASKETLPRKYFSGGLNWKSASSAITRANPFQKNQIVAAIGKGILTGDYSKLNVRFDEEEAAGVVAQLATQPAIPGLDARNDMARALAEAILPRVEDLDQEDPAQGAKVAEYFAFAEALRNALKSSRKWDEVIEAVNRVLDNNPSVAVNLEDNLSLAKSALVRKAAAIDIKAFLLSSNEDLVLLQKNIVSFLDTVEKFAIPQQFARLHNPGMTPSAGSSALIESQLNELADVPTTPGAAADNIRQSAAAFRDSYRGMTKSDFIAALARQSRSLVESIFQEINTDVYQEVVTQLKGIKDLIVRRLIVPGSEGIELVLSNKQADQPKKVVKSKLFKNEDGSIRKPRVLYWPLKGDPWQAGHIWILLQSILKFKIDKVVIGIDNSDPTRKADLTSLAIREAVTLAILKLFLPGLVEYTTLAKDDPKLFTADGERMLPALVKLNQGFVGEDGNNVDLEWFYGAGSDHANLYVLKKSGITAKDFVDTGLTEEQMNSLEKILIRERYLLQNDKGQLIISNPKQKNFKPYEDIGHSEDLEKIFMELGITDQAIKGRVYQAFFQADTPTKVKNNLAAEGLDITLNIIFSQRKGELVDEELLGRFGKQFEKGKLLTVTQIPDGSSTRIRKKNAWFLAPLQMFDIAAAFNLSRWGFKGESAGEYYETQNLINTITGVIPQLATQQPLTPEQIKLNLGLVDVALAGLTGDGIGAFDDFLVRTLLPLEENIANLNTGEKAQYNFLQDLRALSFKRSGDIVEYAINKPLTTEQRIAALGRLNVKVSSSAIAGKSFLLVEDEATNIEFAKIVLEMVGGATVTAVTSGEAALELLKTQKFDGYIFDNTLRGGGGTLRGLDIAKARLAAGDITPIVFASTDFSEPNSNESLELAELMAAYPSVRGSMGKVNLDTASLPAFEAMIASSALLQTVDYEVTAPLFNIGNLTRLTEDVEFIVNALGVDYTVSIEPPKTSNNPYLNITIFREADLKAGISPVLFTYERGNGGVYQSADGKIAFRGMFDLEIVDNMVTITPKIIGGVALDYSQTSVAQKRIAANASTPIGTVGGIDFDPSLLNLQIKRNGKGVPLPMSQQNFETINIDGLYPVIINIQPATIQNFPFLLSADQGQKVPEVSMRPST